MLSDVSSVHRQAWDLIPWIVNGTATESERAIAETHIRECADCRGEFEFQQRLSIAITERVPLPMDPQESWQALRTRLNAVRPESSQRSGRKPARGGARLQTSWLIGAVAVQALGLGGLAVALWSRPPASSPAAPGAAALYHTLSAPDATLPEATIRVVFAPDMTLAHLHELLTSMHLQVLAGPSDAGVWALGPLGPWDRTANQTALRQLRADTRVRFAETIGGAR